MAARLPVLIAGAGPTGLYLALSLTRNGVPVRILHKDNQYHNSSRGSGNMPRTQEIQRFLGVDQALLNWGGPTVSPLMRLYKLPGGTEVIKSWNITDNIDLPISPKYPYREPIHIPQMVHEGVLREELAKFGVAVELGKELKTFTQDEGGVSAELTVHSTDGSPDSTEVVRAAYLCGADGAHGPTRKAIGCTFLGDTETGDAILFADHRLQGLSEEYIWHLWFNKEEGGVNIGCRPLCDGKGTFNTVVMGQAGFDPVEYMKPGGLTKIFHELLGRTDIQVEEPPVSISFFRPNTRMVDKFQEGRVFVLGDAAHVHPPTGGQGLNSSIQDAFNLGWKLALVYKNHAPPNLLATYNEERLPVIAEMLGQTSVLYANTKDKSHDPQVASMRRGAELLQLGVNCRWSSIVVDTRKPAGEINLDELRAHAYGGHDHASLVAGDRAPEAPALIDRKGGKHTSLFDVFDVTKHTVLLFNTSSSKASLTSSLSELLSKLLAKDLVQLVFVQRSEYVSEGDMFTPYRNLVDSEGNAYSAYNVPDEERPTIVVVRPDAYVGAVVHSVEEAGKYFANVFGKI